MKNLTQYLMLCFEMIVGSITTVWVFYFADIKVKKVTKVNFVNDTPEWVVVESDYTCCSRCLNAVGYYSITLERTCDNEVQTRECEIQEKYVEGKYSLGTIIDIP